MDKSALQLLELLRSGLWGKAADPSFFEGVVDWSAIVSTAMDQTVALIVADGYATLPAQLQPPKKIQFSIEALRVRTAQAHQLLNHGLAEFSHLLDDNGIHHVLFKGQGLAQNYINPHSRTCGDIDLYVGEKNLDKAKAIMDDFGEADGKDLDSEKHIHCKRNGVDFELHKIAEVLDLPWKNKRYQAWTQKHLAENGDFEILNVGDAQVNLPPAQFNVLYVFNHMLHHFQKGGIGLRQVCDWACLLHTHAGMYDRDVLKKDLRAFGLTDCWRLFGQIAVDFLGLPAEEMPLYPGPAGRKAEMTMETILYFGNFGRKARACDTPRPKGYWSGKLHSFRYNLRSSYQLFKLFPLKTLISFTAYTIRGTIVALHLGHTK